MSTVLRQHGLGEAMGIKKTARECMLEAVRELVCQRPLEHITASDIIERAGVSRASFYKSFSDKYELVQQVFIDEISKVFFFVDDLMYDRFAGTLRRVEENREFYQNAIKSPEFVTVWMEHAYDSDRNYLALRLIGKGVSDELLDACAYLITQTMACAALDWIRLRPSCGIKECARDTIVYCRQGLEAVLEDHGFPRGTLAEF